MKKRMAALLGSAAAIMTLGASQAATPTSVPAAPPAANSYAELLEPVPQAVAALNADNAARMQAPKARLQLAQFRHHHHHHHHRGGFWPGAAFGAMIGGMLAAQPRYAPAPPPYDPDVAWCMRHYRSYDPGSGTYLGYDGYRHPCP